MHCTLWKLTLQTPCTAAIAQPETTQTDTARPACRLTKYKQKWDCYQLQTTELLWNTKTSTESVIMNYRWKPDLHWIVSLRKRAGQPVCQWKRQDLLLLQCQELQEQQVTWIRIHRRYPESNRENCPCRKEKRDARDNLTLCSNLPPDWKMGNINRWWKQILQKTGLPRVHLINLQQLRLVSFKLCQHCAAHRANTEPFQEPAKPLRTYAVCSQGCVHTVRYLCMHMRDFSLPQTSWFPAQGCNHHSQTEPQYKIKTDTHT